MPAMSMPAMSAEALVSSRRSGKPPMAAYIHDIASIISP